MNRSIGLSLALPLCAALALVGCAGADREGDNSDGTDGVSQDAITQVFELKSCNRMARRAVLTAPQGGGWIPPGRTEPVYRRNDSITINLPFQFANHTGPESFHFHVQTQLSDTEGTEVIARFENGNGTLLKWKSLTHADGTFDVTDDDVPPEATSYSLKLIYFGSNGERAEINWSAECTLS